MRGNRKSGRYRGDRQGRSQGRSPRRRAHHDSARPRDHSQQARVVREDISHDEYHVNTRPEVAIDYLPALFSWFPELIGRIPWVSLRGVLTPAAPRLLLRSRHLFGDNHAFIKNEEDDFHTIPENKARKLEFVIGASLQSKKKKLVSFGYIGSPHCFSTVKAASQLGLKSEVVLIKSPLTTSAVEMVAAMKNLGATVKLRASSWGFKFTAWWNWLCSRVFRTDLVPPADIHGKSCLGYVSAPLELKQQIDDGVLPTPDYLFVPVGSGATLVGLEIGKRLAGLTSLKIVGVQASDSEGISEVRLAEMANNAVRLLNSALKNKLNDQFTGAEFLIQRASSEVGHGLATESVLRWSFGFQELEGIELDPVYTAKALHEMSSYIRKNNIRDKVFLFWNTFSPFRSGDVPKGWTPRHLYWKLKRWIREEQKSGHLVDLGRV